MNADGLPRADAIYASLFRFPHIDHALSNQKKDERKNNKQTSFDAQRRCDTQHWRQSEVKPRGYQHDADEKQSRRRAPDRRRHDNEHGALARSARFRLHQLGDPNNKISQAFHWKLP